MPQHHQPVPLLSLCYAQVAIDLVSTCRKLQLIAQDSTAVYALLIARRRFRPRFISCLPGCIRSQLIEEASRLLSTPAPDGIAVGGPMPLYLLALLLAQDVHRLRVELCCYYGCSHQAALLRLLASEGRGLESLELARSALLRLDRNLFRSALISAASLRQLILRNIAGDSIMQVIGSSCNNLVVLDVSHSRQVTDTGLRHLFLQVELRDKSPDKRSERVLPVLGQSVNFNGGCSSSRGWGRLRILLRLFPWLRANREGDKVKDRSFLLEYCENCNALCKTLKVLNVANTGVTSTGILLVLHYVPELHSLGEYGHVGRALEILHRAWAATTRPGDIQTPPTFGLRAARSQRTTTQRLELIALSCPALQKLAISEPHHSPSALQLFPQSLTTLHLHSIPNDLTWLADLYSYLATTHGHNLQDIALRFFPGEYIISLDLSRIVQSCPNLHTLMEDGTDIIWQQDLNNTSSSLPYLRSIQLGRTITAVALTELLRRAPVLEVAHFYSCPDLRDHHLLNLTTAECKSSNGIMPQNLQCFYIYEASHITGSAVVTLLKSCEYLLHIGNISNWGLDCDDTHWIRSTVIENNLDLQLNMGSHWFCSRCFPTS